MASRLAVLFGLTLVLGAMAVAQEHPTVTAQPNTIYVGADGKYETAPDTALVQFNLSAQEETAKAAYDRASRAAEQIRQILRSLRVSQALRRRMHARAQTRIMQSFDRRLEKRPRGCRVAKAALPEDVRRRRPQLECGRE